MSVDNYPMGSLFRYDVGIQLKTQTTMEERHVKKKTGWKILMVQWQICYAWAKIGRKQQVKDMESLPVSI